MIKVAIGSKNPVKIKAVKEAFRLVWPEKKFTFEAVEVQSGVSDQPMSDEESIIGARNRAKRSREILSAEYGVGIEGGMQQIGKKWWDCGVIVVQRRDGKEGIASSIRMEVPQKMLNLIMQGMELGEACDIIFKKKNSKQNMGHFGLMTNGVISRQHGYRDGVVAALAVFLHPDLFQEK
jgi:inosine/xanthosine triphosphatase